MPKPFQTNGLQLFPGSLHPGSAAAAGGLGDHTKLEADFHPPQQEAGILGTFPSSLLSFRKAPSTWSSRSIRYMDVYKHVSVYTYIHTYVCIYIYRERDVQYMHTSYVHVWGHGVSFARLSIETVFGRADRSPLRKLLFMDVDAQGSGNGQAEWGLYVRRARADSSY